MTVHNAYFCSGHRNDYSYNNFVAPLRNFHIGLEFDMVDYEILIRKCKKNMEENINTYICLEAT